MCLNLNFSSSFFLSNLKFTNKQVLNLKNLMNSTCTQIDISTKLKRQTLFKHKTFIENKYLILTIIQFLI